MTWHYLPERVHVCGAEDAASSAVCPCVRAMGAWLLGTSAGDAASSQHRLPVCVCVACAYCVASLASASFRPAGASVVWHPPSTVSSKRIVVERPLDYFVLHRRRPRPGSQARRTRGRRATLSRGAPRLIAAWRHIAPFGVWRVLGLLTRRTGTTLHLDRVPPKAASCTFCATANLPNCPPVAE
jgi:hypothetical protein